jgi:hypothetical protein
VNQAGILLGLAGLSLSLAVGWSWLRTRPQIKRRQFEEQWPGVAARFFYFVGLPYLAVVAGWLSPRWLGLKGLEYFAFSDTPEMWRQIQQASTLILWECLADSTVWIAPTLFTLLMVAGLRWRLARAGVFGPADVNSSLIVLFYTGLHWAFYRAIFWQLSGNLYLAVVWGIAWVLLESALMAWLQKATPAQQRQLWGQVIILLLTSILFYLTPNLWLVWLAQGLIITVLAWQFLQPAQLQ